MQPILDETALVPCAANAPGARVQQLALTLRALDALGVRNVLRSTKEAPDRDIGSGRGLRSWCFDSATAKEAGLFVAARLSRQPFIDGEGGLFAAAEGNRAVEPTARGVAPALGLGLAALEGGAAVALLSAAIPIGGRIPVSLTILDDAGARTEVTEVLCVVHPREVEANRTPITEAVGLTISGGRALLARASELFPSLLFGSRAIKQIEDLTGSETVFRQLVRHLRALDLGARNWPHGRPYEPSGSLSWSDESEPTLNSGKYGPMRDFPAPPGFSAGRWRLHTKLTGGAGARLYFRSERTKDGAAVLIGYFGPHLPGVNNPT